MFSELGRGMGRAPPTCLHGGFLERAGHALVGPHRRQREMPGPLLDVRDDFSQPPVEASAPLPRCRAVDRCRIKGVREADQAPFELDDLCVLRLLQRRGGVGLERGSEKRAGSSRTMSRRNLRANST